MGETDQLCGFWLYSFKEKKHNISVLSENLDHNNHDDDDNGGGGSGGGGHDDDDDGM
jgi:hypothetical protein